MLLQSSLLVVLAYVVFKLIRSYYAHQFFKKHAPKLPIMAGTKLLLGHSQIFYHPRNWKVIHDAHEKQGKTVGFYLADKPVVSSIDLNFIKKFIVDEADDHPNRMKPYGPLNEITDASLIYAEDEQWRRLRRAFAPAFSKHKVMSPNVQAEIEVTINKLIESIEWRLGKASSERGEHFVIEDVDDIFHRYALELVFSCFFKQGNLIDFYADKDPWQSNVSAVFRDETIYPAMIICNTFPIVAPLAQIVVKLVHPHGSLVRKLKEFIRQQTRIHSVARKQLNSARKRSEEAGNKKFNEDDFILNDGSRFRRNMIDYVIERYNNGMISDQEYENSTYFLFLAANQTSAEAISKLVYLLAENQNIQEKLRNSVLEKGFESEYLSWSVNEAMRLFPPAPIGCSRTITKDLQSEAGTIPSGTFVLTPAFTINRLKEYWGQDADEFKPERWANWKNFHPCQYLTFGAGRRACPGRDFALQETLMLMDSLIRRFQFDLCTDRKVDIMRFQAPNFVSLVPEQPTWIKISRIKA